MSIFKSILRGSKRLAGRGCAKPSASALQQPEVSRADSRPPVVVDEAMLLLSRELSELARTKVPAGAKERGWAALEREMQRHPVHAASAATAGTKSSVDARSSRRNTRSGGLRWALGGAAATIAVVAAVLATYGGTALQTADNGSSSTTITSVAGVDSTSPVTVPTGSTTGTQDTNTTGASVPDSTSPQTSEGSVAPNTTQGSGATQSTGSTQRTTTTGVVPTTNPQQNAAARIVATAKEAAFDLGSMVVTGNASGARSLVASGAQSSLAQMLMSLEQPFAFNLSSSKAIDDQDVRVVLEIEDRVSDGSGEIVETAERFVLKIRVGDGGAQVIAISAGS
jgi:hypothetical protein